MLIVNILTDENYEVIMPHFVRKRGDVWIKCGDYRAEAIALHAKLYRIMATAGDIYYVEPYDEADRITALAKFTRQTDSDLMSAAFDLDTQREDIINALFELDTRLEAIENG